MNRIFLALLVAAAMSTSIVRAQESQDTAKAPTPEELKESVDGLGERLTTAEATLEKLASLKISGYVQADWQHFDQTTNAGRAVPGYFDARKNFFTVRRGRLKFQSKLANWMDATTQFDVIESGLSIREAYVELKPFSDETFTIIAGSQNRPNYEVEVSSSALEALERSQVTKAFYPSEYDLGLQLTSTVELFDGFNPKLQVGIFNGPGPTPEVDAYKDIITRLTFPVPLGDGPVQADLGATFYYGGVPQLGDSVRETVDGTTKLVHNDETGSMAGMGNRKNVNVEGQIYLDLLPFGGTIIKGEYMNGTRPTLGTAATAASLTLGGVDSLGNPIVKVVPGTAATPLQLRNQGGYYFYFIQNIQADLQLVFRLDYFDRNTDLAGAQVTNVNDAATTVMGIGVNWFFGNARISALYEIPKFAASENIQNDPVTKKPSDDYRVMDLKDNKTTIRFQYKF